MQKIYDVAGMGSPLLDFIVEIEDQTLVDVGLQKGTMTLISEDDSVRIFKQIIDRKIVIAPGGSSANTLAGVSILGGKSVFMGKIGNDEHGNTYAAQSNAAGVICHFSRDGEVATGHAITFVTPDGERTFATHLGASLYFRKQDVNDEDIAASKIIHFEGYQLDDPGLREAVLHAMEIAKANDTRVSIDLSDPGVITRNHDLIMQLLQTFVDIVFVNEVEAEVLTGKPAEEAVVLIAKLCDVAVVKVGDKGSYVQEGTILHRISPFQVNVENTNGAGDMYAAGILYGLTSNVPIKEAGHIASFAASQVVAQREARLSHASAREVNEFVRGMLLDLDNK